MYRENTGFSVLYCDWCGRPIDLDNDYYIEFLLGLSYYDPLCEYASFDLHPACVIGFARYTRSILYVN